MNQIYTSELVLFREYTDLKDKEKKTTQCLRNLNQASLKLKKISDKKTFFSSYSSINKCFSTQKIPERLNHLNIQNKHPIYNRCAIINAIQSQLKTDFMQQTKKIVKIIKLKNESKKNELAQRIILTKTFLKLKKLSHVLTHFLKLTCNCPEYHNLYDDDTRKHLEYLIQESAIIFVANWIKLNLDFVQKKTPMPNAPVILTLFMNNLNIVKAL